MSVTFSGKKNNFLSTVNKLNTKTMLPPAVAWHLDIYAQADPSPLVSPLGLSSKKVLEQNSMSNLKHYGVILYKNGLPTELYLNRLFNAGDYTLDSILGGLKLEVEEGSLDCDAYLPVVYILDDKSYKMNTQFGTLIELTNPKKVFINGPKANYVKTANK